MNALIYISLLFLLCNSAIGTEFTFDLEDSAEECFHEFIGQNVACTFEYQVVSGGQLDVDAFIEGPDQQLVYKEQQKEHDRFKFNTTEEGEYHICFNNQFSTVSDKSIYLSFEAGKKNIFAKETDDHDSVETFFEMTSDTIHYNLDDVINAQTHFRVQEAQARHYAMDLNDRVMWWSLSQTFLILAIGISQVLIMRNFFSDPKPKISHSRTATILLGNQPHFYG